MITSNHVQEELKISEEIINNPNTDINKKIKVLYKLLTIGIKLGVNIRTNTKLIMEHFGIKFIDNNEKK